MLVELKSDMYSKVKFGNVF